MRWLLNTIVLIIINTCTSGIYDFYIIIAILYNEDSCSAGVQVCQHNWVWVWSPLEEMKCLFKFKFSFLRSGVKAKHGVEFRHSIRNAFRIWRKWGKECYNTRLPTVYLAVFEKYYIIQNKYLLR